jgi:CRISPR/Cas system-associated exonuclease Cas4 (RecB family)
MVKPNKSSIWIAARIREAIHQNPNRLIDDYRYNFVIMEDGRIFDRQRAPFSTEIRAISVHSHSPMNWQDFPDDPNYQTLNYADITAFHWEFKRMYSQQIVVMVAEGRFDLFEVELKEENREKLISFIGLTKRQIEDELSIPAPIESNEIFRIKLRAFAKKYGFRLYEYLVWRE